jgi:hypothetical protein
VYELIVHDEKRRYDYFTFDSSGHIDVRAMMSVVVPVIVMVAFSALYAGTYLWMRRESFGEGRHEGRIRRRPHH